MVWGCFSFKGFHKIVLINGIMDKYKYANILVNNILDFDYNKKIFQQDNDPKHTSYHLKEFFEMHKINVLPWPAQSSDLNPIENVWSIIKSKIRGKNFKNKQELFNEIKNIWDNLDANIAKKLVASVQNRVFEVLKNNGGSIKY